MARQKRWTQGEWSVIDSEVISARQSCSYICERPGIETDDVIIVCYGMDSYAEGVGGATEEEAMANAHLMRAAPKLVEALEAVVEHYGYATEELMSTVQAALAQAYGERSDDT